MSVLEQRRPQLTLIAVEPAATPGAPVHLTLRSGLVAARLVSRDTRRAEVALVAGGALLLGGDSIEVRIDVADGCELTITDVGGTVAYDGDGLPSRWDAHVRLGTRAALVWSGMPFIVSDGADVERTTTARLRPGAFLRIRETVVLGRSGESGGRLVLRSEVVDDEGPLLVEELTVSGDDPVPGVLGDNRVLDTVTDVRLAQRDDDELAAETPIGVTRLDLEHGGRLDRWLGTQTHLSPLRALAEMPIPESPPLEMS